MRKLTALILTVSILLTACGVGESSRGISFIDDQRLKISISVPPIQWLVNQIGADLVQTQSLTSSGDDPHTYEPSPAQMTAMAVSDLFLTAGVEFETVWVPKFTAANNNLQVIDITEGVERIPIVGNDAGGDKEHEGLDPHVWLLPANMKIIARNIASILEQSDPQNAEAYRSNLEDTLAIIDEVNNQLSRDLSQPMRKQFMVIHPSLGYIANAFGLVMVPVEIGGQEPSPTQLAEILAATKSYGIDTLFSQPGVSPVNTKTLASQAGISKIVEIDPLMYDWKANVLFIGESLQAALN